MLHEGEKLAEWIRCETRRDYQRDELIKAQCKKLSAERVECLGSDRPLILKGQALSRLKGIGLVSSWILAAGFFY